MCWLECNIGILHIYPEMADINSIIFEIIASLRTWANALLKVVIFALTMWVICLLELIQYTIALQINDISTILPFAAG